MSQSKRSSPSKCLKVRQTMFQFLKRKKKNDLEQSLKQFGNSQSKFNNYDTNRLSAKKDYYSRAKSSAAYDNIVLDQHDTIPLFSNQRNRQANSSNITPRKITFLLDEQQPKTKGVKSGRKPLYQMISPIKKGIDTIGQSLQRQTFYQSNSKTNRYASSNQKKGILKSKSLLKDNSEPFSKRKIQSSLSQLKQTVYTIFQAGQTARQKNNQLSINLVNLAKQIIKQKGSNLSKQINQKLGEIKYVIKALQSSLNIFVQPSEINSIIQQFHKNFSQHLNQIQASHNHNSRQQIQQKVRQVQYEKQGEIGNLQIQKNKLQRQLQKINRKLQRTQNQYQKMVKQYQQRQQNLLITIQNIRNQSKNQSQNFYSQINLLKQSIEQQRHLNKQLQKQLKDIVYKAQKQMLSAKQKQQDATTSREQYLLEQIQKLKQQSTLDVAKLHQLYQSKNQDLQRKLLSISAQLSREKQQRKSDRHISDRILQEASFSRTENIKLLKKNQQVIRDLYRMNQQLYQHWLALKDIKTLSQRLKLFSHFERIYLDMAFNPLLFRASE